MQHVAIMSPSGHGISTALQLAATDAGVIASAAHQAGYIVVFGGSGGGGDMSSELRQLVAPLLMVANRLIRAERHGRAEAGAHEDMKCLACRAVAFLLPAHPICEIKSRARLTCVGQLDKEREKDHMEAAKVSRYAHLISLSRPAGQLPRVQLASEVRCVTSRRWDRHKWMGTDANIYLCHQRAGAVSRGGAPPSAASVNSQV